MFRKKIIFHPFEDRYKPALSLVKHNFKNVLDVGCGKKILKKYLSGNIYYQGIDAEEGEDVISFNLEKGIPFKNESFDIVFCLDVLEHLDNPQFLLEEILRVAKKEVIISLPNMYHWMFRLMFCSGKMPGHYDFSSQKVNDLRRHKWLTSYSQSVEFIKSNAKNYNVDVAVGVYKHQKLKFMRKIDKLLSQFSPSVFGATIFFHIDKLSKNA